MPGNRVGCQTDQQGRRGDRLPCKLRKSGRESNAWFGRRGYDRRVDNVHHSLQDRDYGGFMNIEPFFKFFFEGHELLGEFALVA